MEKRLIALILRHGETELNAGDCFRSRLDPPLDDNGIRQAEKAAKWIAKNHKIFKIVSSPQLRAVQTADIVAEEVGVCVEQDRGLMPWALGFLSGKDKEKFQPILDLFIDNPKTEIPDGESLDAFEERTSEFFEEALRCEAKYAETGTPESNYAENGPYHCEDCVHRINANCIHPKVVKDSKLKDRLVQIDGKKAVKINLEKGCCRYVMPAGEEYEAPSLNTLLDAEHDAVADYTETIDASKDSTVIRTLKHIREEEKEHARELVGLGGNKKEPAPSIPERHDVVLFVCHTSNVVCLENQIKGNRDGRPESGETSVGTGGIAAVYLKGEDYDIEPVFGETKEAEFGS